MDGVLFRKQNGMVWGITHPNIHPNGYYITFAQKLNNFKIDFDHGTLVHLTLLKKQPS